MNLFTGFLVEDEVYMSQLVNFYNKYQTRVLSCLPWVAAELANNSGFSTMIEIIQQYGGRKLYIATNKEDFNKKLNINLSDNQYHRIIENTDARGFVDLPSLWGIFLAVRRAAIIEALDEGRSKDDIIRNFGITERGLRNYKVGASSSSR
ncbi:MAG: hypothetical protein HRT35_01025 [Algicola sp.]|nr:hypothetical protein [Algicola sp.]